MRRIKNLFAKRKKDYVFRFMDLCLLFCAAVVFVFFYWILIDNNYNPPGKSVPYRYTSVVPRGQSFEATYIVDRYRNCDVRIDREFQNQYSNEIFETGYTRTNEYSEESIYKNIEVDLPDSLSEGFYRYHIVLNYYCNPSNVLFGPIQMTPPDIFFEIQGPNAKKTFNRFRYRDEVRKITLRSS